MRINEIIKLSDAFATEVNVLRDYAYKMVEGNKEKVRGYLPNKSSRDIINSILLSCPESIDKKLHLITASYGTGKSYLLLMLANLLANNNKEALKSLIEKIQDKESFYKDNLTSALNNHIDNSAPFLVVIPEYGDTDFNHSLLEALKFSLQKNGIEYVPKTNYEDAIRTINHWKSKTPHSYELLKEHIISSTVDKFIEQLQAYNPATYLEFKNYFQEIIGAPFPEAHTSAYPIFADTAKEIRKYGFRGIAIIYDEFGEMLGKLINSSSSATGIAVQEFLENIKAKKENCNLLFISASHQDPQSLKASKEKELNKIIGRFEKHQLIVSESEGEEIIGSIFIKENKEEFEEVYKHSLFKEHLSTIEGFKIYPEKDVKWIEAKILRNLYPLHPLTAFILPKLSSEFAQNTRSMFNFLSPTETKDGAFKFFLNSNEVISNNKLNLFTPDLLLDFFLKNIQEDKEGRVQVLYDAYRTGIGKVNDPHHQSIMKNLFMLWVVNVGSIRPSRETLFWAMNWEESRRREFYNLLDDLTVSLEYLELNPIDKIYQFPALGAAPLSKVIDEEVKKLDDLTQSQCLEIWQNIVPLENLHLHDHHLRYGSNKIFYTEAIEDVGHLITSIQKLKGYYNYTVEYLSSGYIFYFIGSSEDEIEELKKALLKEEAMLPYIVFATPINIPQFDTLRKDTLQLKAIENTAVRPDVMQNVARSKSILEQYQSAKRKLEEKLKYLFEPINWKWSYRSEQDIELTSRTKFSNWINSKIDLLFAETPTIKDDALWFVGNKGSKDRKQALYELFNADKGRIPLRDESDRAPAHMRVLRNFFNNIGLTTDLKRDKSVQYGEIKLPDQDSQVYKAWKLIESKLKSGAFISPLIFINPLLQQPFGLSEQIIKFLLASFIRYDIERVVIASARNRAVQSISVDLIESLMARPSDYLIRKIEMSGPELRYLGQLKTLFDKQDVNSWIDLSQKFIGVIQYQTPLHKGIIQDSGNPELQSFYQSLEEFKTELQSAADKDKVSQEYFQDHLPALLLDEGRSFMDDSEKVGKIIKKLENFKKHPYEKEVERKMEVIQALAEDVFGARIVTKHDITAVVQNWFKTLPTPNQNGKFENKIKNWLLEVKLATTNDPFELYLEKLNEKPFKDWVNFAYEKFTFVSRFKDYKKTVEEYTKSPIEVLQIIARDVFEKSAAECNSEQAFDGFFKEWWNSLPGLYKSPQYSPQTNLLISQISLAGSAVKARYLETLPQVWKESNFLEAFIPREWELWSNSNTYAVAEKYKTCIQEVLDWKPPVEESELFHSLGDLFTTSRIDTLNGLYKEVRNWHNELPERTQNANWLEIDRVGATLLSSLNREDAFYDFITVKAPELWDLPVLKHWNQSVLESYVKKFQALKEKIDLYKRPLSEIVLSIEGKAKEKSKNPEEFCLTLSIKIKDSEAYRNKINGELLNDLVAASLYLAMQSRNLTMTTIVSTVSGILGISDEWHLWTEKQEKLFVSGLKKGIDTLLKWKFPEAERLKKAKVKVKEAISKLQNDLELDDVQMRKVLNDIVEGK